MVVTRVDLFGSQLVFLFSGWLISEVRPRGPLHNLPLPQLSNMPVAVQNCSFFRWDLSQTLPHGPVLSCPVPGGPQLPSYVPADQKVLPLLSKWFSLHLVLSY